MLSRILRIVRLTSGFLLKGSKAVDWRDRLWISFRVLWARLRNRGRSATTYGEQLVLIDAILEIPRTNEGVIAEFGCYKGLSTVALSIAARYSKRRLLVFDSFEGLPEPKNEMRHIADGTKVVYRKGDCVGSL